MLAFAACGVSAHAVPLTWDTDPLAAGAQGGAGTWANGSTNWWNGAANTAWNNATPDSATFGGTSGAVTVDAAGITTAGMIFDAAGYTVAGGAIALGSGFTLTANADVTIPKDSIDRDSASMLLVVGRTRRVLPAKVGRHGGDRSCGAL